MRMSFLAALVCAAFAASLSFSAHASSGDAAAAETLFKQGLEAMAAADFDTACAKLSESDRLDPGVGTKFNLADCEEKRGRFAEAWRLFKEVVAALPETDGRRPMAQARAEQVKARVPHLTIEVQDDAGEGARIARDGEELESQNVGVAVPLSVGAHSVRVEAPGHAPRVYELELAEGETKTLVVTTGDAIERPTTGGLASASEDSHASDSLSSAEVSTSDSSRTTLGYVIGGVGLLGLAAGGVAGIMTLDRKSTADENCLPIGCDDTGRAARDSGKTLGTLTTVGLAVGAVGLGVGLYLVLSADDEGGAETVMQTDVTPGGGQLLMSHRW